MTITTDASYKSAYDRKKENSAKRNIPFLLTEEEYTAIMKSRPTMVCGYTNAKFVMNQGSSHKSYPELDRIDENKPYQKDNVIFATKKAHKLKTDYVENDRSRKGLSHGNVCILRSIEKTLQMPNVLATKLAPYYDIYSKVELREQEKEDKKVKAVQRDEAHIRQEALDKVTAEMEEQQELANHYRSIVAAMKSCGLVYALSIKVHRDVFRRSTCAISKKKFATMDNKFLWIPDKDAVLAKGYVEKGDFVVTSINVAEELDKLSVLGNTKAILINTLRYL